jgi:hypothetical protein
MNDSGQQLIENSIVASFFQSNPSKQSPRLFKMEFYVKSKMQYVMFPPRKFTSFSDYNILK